MAAIAKTDFSLSNVELTFSNKKLLVCQHRRHHKAQHWQIFIAKETQQHCLLQYKTLGSDESFKLASLITLSKARCTLHDFYKRFQGLRVFGSFSNACLGCKKFQQPRYAKNAQCIKAIMWLTDQNNKKQPFHIFKQV